MRIKLGTTKEENNVRLYPIYKMLSWDLLFYYSINFIFLTQIKGISAADVLLAEAFYPFCKIILLIPLTALINKIGKRKSLIFANATNALSIMCYIIAQDFTYILIGQLLSAVAFNIKGIVETNLLYDNLPRNEKRGHQFSKIDGRATSWYYYIDALTSIAAGFLYVLNGYLPFILCFIGCLISTYLSFKFTDTDKDKLNMQNNITTRQYIKDLRVSFKYMLQSDRLKYLFIFGAIFTGLLSVLVSPRSNILEEIGVPEQYFGIIFAVLGIISGLAAKNQNIVHNKFRNKTLGVISIPTTISCIIIGFFALAKNQNTAFLIIILTMFVIQYIAKGLFYTLIRRYLNNFTTSELRSKIISAYNLIESIIRTIMALFISWLLRGMSASNMIIFLGCILTIIIILLIDKMRNKVGLKPEEYSKKEIEFIPLK